MEEIHIKRISTSAFLTALCQRGNPQYLLIGISTLLAVQAPTPMTWRQLADCLYADDEDGGCLWARESIAATICRLRKRGVPIKTRKGGMGYYMDRAA